MQTQAVPTTVVDGFYDDPQKVREFALRQSFFTSKEYAGRRTEPLHILDPEFFDHFCFRLMALEFDLIYAQAQWEIFTAFHIVDPTENTPSWVHKDDRQCVAAGVIHLSDDVGFDEGTSLYVPNRPISPAMVNHWADVKESFHGDGIDNNYVSELKAQHECFDETVRVGAAFNRLAMYESDVYHAARPSKTTERLTQVFFIKRVTAVSRLPVQRLINIKWGKR